LGQVKD